MKVNKYPDGTSYITEPVLGQQVFRINSYEDLWHLNQFVDAFNNKFNSPMQPEGIGPNIIIPNLLDAQADRRFGDDQSHGLMLVLKHLAGMKTKFQIFHPHNAEAVEMAFNIMGKKVTIIDNSEFIRTVLNNFFYRAATPHPKHQKKTHENLILMSSDAGGFKPLMKLCDQLNWEGETYSASKARTKDGMKQLVDREDFGGKDILIVDDICVYGGTFKGLSKLLKERNCGKLYLAVSHMTVQNLGDDPVTNYFDKVFTTNSKFDTYVANHFNTLDGPHTVHPKNLEIIKLF